MSGSLHTTVRTQWPTLQGNPCQVTNPFMGGRRKIFCLRIWRLDSEKTKERRTVTGNCTARLTQHSMSLSEMPTPIAS